MANHLPTTTLEITRCPDALPGGDTCDIGTCARCDLLRNEEVRPATERERFANGFGTTGETICSWCGTEAAEQVVFGSRIHGQMAWSPAYCSVDCHLEAIEG